MNTQEANPSRLRILTRSAQLQGARWRQEHNGLFKATVHGGIASVADGLGGHARGDETTAIGAATDAKAVLPLIEQPQPIAESTLRDVVRTVQALFVEASA